MLRRILKSIILFIAATALILLSIFTFIYTWHYVPPIVMYHSIGVANPGQDMLTVSMAAFERQMCFLKKHRYNVISLDELARMIKEKKRPPFKTIVLTFDDGYKDNYTLAYPILKKYNLKATIFVILKEIDRPDRLSWGQIKEMQASGLITIGSHTLGPGILTEMQPWEEVKRYIFDSKKILEERLGREVYAFSYPQGRFNKKVRQLVVDAGYRLAVATSPGRRYPSDDLFALKRIRISENSNNLFIFWIETSGMYTFMKEHRRHGH
ncbi:MAG: polysaccharide deacetylase family protein [Candidatus Omnitrophica bacterium]|nr:polysaccharide deacetylase family protein [Candidatus Omnitrophota bacterium]MDD5237032.1 polysaccharide deacetylase family protein [Candidatus Omnitrophota bacterium]MDD5610932.1 polysaccharide deacetylase family protein [Candidatus Omnitrophota bacterium]